MTCDQVGTDSYVRNMRTRSYLFRTGAYAWLLALALWVTAAEPVASDVEVIVNDSVDQRALSVTTVRAIFGMRLRTWPDGKPIEVFVLYDEDPLHNAFCKQVLNIFPHQLRLAWDRLVFSGTGQAPNRVTSPEEMRWRVAHTIGAIGYTGEAVADERVRIPALEQ